MMNARAAQGGAPKAGRSEVAASDQETLATVADLINRGQVRLCGDAAGATIDLSATEDTAA